MSSSKQLKILFLSHTHWGSVYRIGSHHLSYHMARSGHTVSYVSTPVTPFHRFTLDAADSRLRNAGRVVEIVPGLKQYIPVLPIPASRFFVASHDLSLCFSKNTILKALEDMGGTSFDLVLIDQPKLLGVLNLVQATRVTYRPTDIYAGMGLRNWRYLEASILGRSDAVVCTSAPVAKHIEANFAPGLPLKVFENGVDYDHFYPRTQLPQDIADLPGKKVIYVGALDTRFDFELYSRLVCEFPNSSFVLIGGGMPERLKPIEGRANFRYLGTRSYEDVPSYLSACDVGLMPFVNSTANSGRSPMKFYEYLACGLPIVASSTPELERRSLDRTHLYKNYNEAHAALALAAQEPKKPVKIEEFGWASIADRVLSFSMGLGRE